MDVDVVRQVGCEKLNRCFGAEVGYILFTDEIGTPFLKIYNQNNNNFL